MNDANPSPVAPSDPRQRSTAALAAGGGAGKPTKLEQTPWGAVVVITGLVAIVVVSITAMLHYKQASDVATATVGVSGVIAALVGAYFGIRGSSLAQTNATKAGEEGI